MNALQRAILTRIIEEPMDCAGVSIPVLKEIIARTCAELVSNVAYAGSGIVGVADELSSRSFEAWKALEESDNNNADPMWSECSTCECFALIRDFEGEHCPLCVAEGRAG